MSVKFRQEQTIDSAIKAIEKLELRIKNQQHISGSSYAFFNQQTSSVKKERVENTSQNTNSSGRSRSSS